MIDYKTIRMGKVFDDLRRKKQLSQEEMAYRSERDRRTISDLERDVSLPSLETFINIACALRMKPSKLMKEIEENTNLLDQFPDLED